MTMPIAETAVPGLTFHEDEHRYEYQGETVPSVTSILRLITDRIYEDIPPWQFERAALRGTHAHKATEYDDMSILDYEGLDPELKPYVDAWRAFREDTGFHIEAIELRVYHPSWRCAGTIDRVGWLNGKRCVVDIKTTVALHPVTGLQLAGYLESYNAAHGPDAQASQRWAVQLKKDGTYQLKQYADPSDKTTFMAALQLNRWLEACGG